MHFTKPFYETKRIVFLVSRFATRFPIEWSMGFVQYFSGGVREDTQGREDRQRGEDRGTQRGQRAVARGQRVLQGTKGCRGDRGHRGERGLYRVRTLMQAALFAFFATSFFLLPSQNKPTCIVTFCQSIAITVLKALMQSMPRRLVEVMEHQGATTQY